MIGASVAGFEFVKLSWVCIVCGGPFDALLTLLDTKERYSLVNNIHLDSWITLNHAENVNLR